MIGRRGGTHGSIGPEAESSKPAVGLSTGSLSRHPLGHRHRAAQPLLHPGVRQPCHRHSRRLDRTALPPETEFGARLDSLADDITFFLAFLGLVILDRDFVWGHRFAFTVLLASHLGAFVVPLIRFGRTTSLHLYSSKVSGYLLGFFIFFYFLFGYSAWYFYFAFGFSVLAFLEGLVITLISQEPRSNVRGLYWVLQERRPRPESL